MRDPIYAIRYRSPILVSLACSDQGPIRRWKPDGAGSWKRRRRKKWDSECSKPDETLVTLRSLPLEQQWRMNEMRHAINIVSCLSISKRVSPNASVYNDHVSWKNPSLGKQQQLSRQRVTVAYPEGANLPVSCLCFQDRSPEQTREQSDSKPWVVKETPAFLEISPGLCWGCNCSHQNGDNATQLVLYFKNQ